MKKCGWDENSSSYKNKIPSLYDFYGTFGLSLGENPKEIDSEIAALSTSIINLPDGEFYHFGANKEIISSSLALQNKVSDQKAFLTRNVKPHPAIFVQNAQVDISLSEDHGNLWIENSHIGNKWKLGGNQVLTGIPRNDWSLEVPEGICLDIAPLGNDRFVIRPYGIKDSFRGLLSSDHTMWQNSSFSKWLKERNLNLETTGLDPEQDIQDAPFFQLFLLIALLKL